MALHKSNDAGDFQEIVKKYESFLTDTAQISNSDNLRIETQIESLKDWSSVYSYEELKKWYLDQKNNCGMSVIDIPLSECRGWRLDKDTGEIKHKSNEFFKVQGVRISNSDSREVDTGWDQPIITQIGYDGGLLGLLRKRINGVPHYLIEAKAEPGNPDLLQISPTLQATFSNLKRAHGGSKPKFAEFFETPDSVSGLVLFNQWMSEDGGRLHLKRNKGMLIEISEDFDLGVIPSSFAWVSLWQLKALLKENSWVNPHIRGIISHL